MRFQGTTLRRRHSAAWLLGLSTVLSLGFSQAVAQAPSAPANARPMPAADAGSDHPRGSPRPLQRVRILASRSHTQCPLDGDRIAVLSIDSPQEWAQTLKAGEEEMVGRGIRWSREQVLVYAMNRQATLGVSVEPANQVLAVKSGVLFWPVREKRPAPGAMAATAVSRPCLVAVVKRTYYQRIRILRK